MKPKPACSHEGGMIEVISGCMFSGKSEEFIRRLRRVAIAEIPMQVFKHCSDNRYDDSDVVSHSGLRIVATPVPDSSAILRALRVDTRVVGVDEAQFFDDLLPGVLNDMADQGIRVVVAGLNLDSRRRPYGPMPTILALAGHRTILHAICARCKSMEAEFSYRLAPVEERDHVGAHNDYEARCRRCYLETST